MINTTAVNELPPLPSYTLRTRPSLIQGFADEYLTLALPIIAYWGVSLIFHLIDEWDLFPHYRLHTPAEVLKRNHVSRWEVFRDVVIQQVVQTLFGIALAAFDGPQMIGKEEYNISLWARRIRVAQKCVPVVLGAAGLDAKALADRFGTSHATLASVLAGGTTTDAMFAQWELLAAQTIYHAIIPAFQFLLAICIVDTWQYFLHRAMHMNKYLYTTFHSRHHRLYVPYAYGALYNHPFEGFLLDTLGTGLAYLVSGMTCRQSMWFFTCSTIKTVDDHCGYAFPWDPLQRMMSNNAGYHDVHHQSWGIKTNFSQPFFTFWDSLLGTKWTGGDVSARYERAKIAAQKKVDSERQQALTTSTRSDSTSSVSPNPYNPPAGTPTARPTEPLIPSGKALQQALSSRQQVLDDRKNGGLSILLEEASEERAEVVAQKSVRPKRKRTTSSGLKGLADWMSEGLHGKGTGVLGVESGRS